MSNLHGIAKYTTWMPSIRQSLLSSELTLSASCDCEESLALVASFSKKPKWLDASLQFLPRFLPKWQKAHPGAALPLL